MSTRSVSPGRDINAVELDMFARADTNSDKPVKEVTFNATLESTAAKANSQVKFHVHQRDANSPQVSGDTPTPEHTMIWDSEKIVLTHTTHDGTGPRQVGHTEAEWRQIADSIRTMLDAKKAADLQQNRGNFTFSVARFNVQTGRFEYRPTDNDDPKEETFSPGSFMHPSAQGVFNIINSNAGTLLNYHSRPAQVNQPGHPQTPPPPPPDPMNNVVPTTPAKESLPKELLKKFKGLFNRRA